MIFPLGWAGSIFLAENESRIYPNICAKFGCGPTVVSKKRGVQTDRQRKLQLYIVDQPGYLASFGIIVTQLNLTVHFFVNHSYMFLMLI